VDITFNLKDHSALKEQTQEEQHMLEWAVVGINILIQQAAHPMLLAAAANSSFL
jgi:hypothetical protein